MCVCDFSPHLSVKFFMLFIILLFSLEHKSENFYRGKIGFLFNLK